MPEKIDHKNCRTRPKMDDLWECLVNEALTCPYLIPYGTKRYCIHKDHITFEKRSTRSKQGDLR